MSTNVQIYNGPAPKAPNPLAPVGVGEQAARIGNGTVIRAAAQPYQSRSMGEEALVTELVFGTPQSRSITPSLHVLDPIGVPSSDSWEFEWWKFFEEHMQVQETARPLRAEMRTIDWKAAKERDEFKRDTLAITFDELEQRVASARLRFRARATALVKQVLDLSLEVDRANLLLDPASYAAGHAVTLGPGDEFDTNGNAAAVVQDLAEAVATAIGIVSPDDIHFLVPELTLRAALKDPPWRAKRDQWTDKEPTLADLAAHWGISTERIHRANVMVKAEGERHHVYPDVLIAFYPGDRSRKYDTRWGDQRFGGTFRPGSKRGGYARKPFFNDANTSWYLPYEAIEQPRILRPDAGAILYNCSSAVGS